MWKNIRSYVPRFCLDNATSKCQRSKLCIFLTLLTVVLFLNLVLYIRDVNYYGVTLIGSGTDDDNVLKLNTINWIKKKDKKILLWTTFFQRTTWHQQVQIGLDGSKHNKCTATIDKGEIKDVDAVIFHYLDLYFWEKMPSYRHPNQTWVLFNEEAPPMQHYVGFLPFKNTFNWTMSYRSDATVFAPYGDIRKHTPWELLKLRYKFKRNYAKGKTKMAVAVIGDCYDHGGRYKLVKELGKYIPIDYYGNCGNLSCPRASNGDLCTSPKYRFKLAFENAMCKEYATEKFWGAFGRNMIPVVNWMVNITNAPPHSYINIFDFPSIKDAADHMIKLSKNDTLYNEYFDWKKTHKITYLDSIWPPFSKLCDMLHKPKEAQVIRNPSKWMYNDVCSTWSVGIVIAHYGISI